MKNKKKSLIPPLLICLLGLAIILYLPISDYLRNRQYQQDLKRYDTLVHKADTSHIFQQAQHYNSLLAQTPDPLKTQNPVSGYKDTLVMPDTDIMGYIVIPKINARLPIYHGTNEGTLGDGIGHLEGSSLPIGGPSTHSVLVGHRGLSTATLFTRLDEMEKGDRFMIQVLDKKLYYQVDQIKVVEPDDIKDLKIVEGKDYCTLLTCTPFGINTQRLLVRGKRIPKPQKAFRDTNGFSIPPLYLKVLIGMVVVLIIVFITMKRRKRGK